MRVMVARGSKPFFGAGPFRSVRLRGCQAAHEDEKPSENQHGKRQGHCRQHARS
jgi:hypothetical protein